MKKGIKNFKFPETNDKFLNIAEDWISNDNKKENRK